VVPVTPLSDAPMVVVPVLTGDAKPPLVMVATAVLLEDQVAEFVTFPTVPSENVADAVNCCCWPLDNRIVGFVGLTVMALTVLLLTVNVAVAVLLLLDLAVIVLVPSATAVARPEELMVATLVDEEAHVTDDVTSPVVLLPKVAVAVNCCVAVGLMSALVGDIAIETMVSEEGKKPLQLASNKTADNAAATMPDR
jgi:hypothetical protein